MKLSIYCSGSIAKGASDEKKLCWSDNERGQVSQGAQPAEVIFLNPDDPITDPTNFLGQFGRDMFQVMVCTAVVVDARERRGLGIGVEMTAAASMGVPVIVVAPRNSKYRCDLLEYRGVQVKDYVHPHVASLATAVVDDFVSAGKELLKLSHGRQGRNFVSPNWLNAAIHEYLDNVLPGDKPMVDAVQSLGLEPPLIPSATR